MSFTITGFFIGGAWLALGRPSLHSIDSQLKLRIPKIKPTPPPVESTSNEFASFRELFTYLQTEDDRKKKLIENEKRVD